MKNFAKLIKDEWNAPVREAQLKINEHAPVESHSKPTVMHRDASMRMFHLINEELNELRTAVQDYDVTDEQRLIDVADALGDILYLTFGTVAQFGMQNVIESVVDEIHKSNLTKLQGDKIILRSDGKVMKPSTYLPPKLKPIIFDYKE